MIHEYGDLRVADKVHAHEVAPAVLAADEELPRCPFRHAKVAT
jgi:hypothetical protein